MKSQQRQDIRRKRLALSKEIVATHSQIVCEKLLTLPSYQQAKHIACYSAIGNEVDLNIFIQQALQQDKYIYLPVIADIDNHMHFYRFHADTELKQNRFKISEPTTKTSTAIEANQLDLILMPLVAFDEQCHRIGQGGGFYDAYLQQSQPTQTTTIGVAYEMQKLESITPDDWDIPPNMIVTESAIYSPAK